MAPSRASSQRSTPLWSPPACTGVSRGMRSPSRLTMALMVKSSWNSSSLGGGGAVRGGEVSEVMAVHNRYSCGCTDSCSHK
jgi:hypothetical protein